jgi:hypothetical protein
VIGSPIPILLVDDHELIRVGIATLLLPESDMKIVCEPANGRKRFPNSGNAIGCHTDGPPDAGDEWL